MAAATDCVRAARPAPRADAARGGRADRRARLLRDPDRRRGPAGRRQPGAGHLLLRHQGRAAHRGAALLRAVVLRRTSTAELERLRTARERLEMLVRTTCVPAGEGEIPGAWGLWFDLWAQAFRHPEVAKDRIELDQRWRDTIAQVVARRPGARRDRRPSTPTRSRSRSPRCSTGCRSRSRCEDPVGRPGAGVRDRDGLRGQASSDVAVAAASRHDGARRLRPGAPPLTPAGRAAPRSAAAGLVVRRRRAAGPPPAGRWRAPARPGDERRRQRLAGVGHRDQQGLPVGQPDDDVGASARGRRPGRPARGSVLCPVGAGAGRRGLSVMRSGRTTTLPGRAARRRPRAAASAPSRQATAPVPSLRRAPRRRARWPSRGSRRRTPCRGAAVDRLRRARPARPGRRASRRAGRTW